MTMPGARRIVAGVSSSPGNARAGSARRARRSLPGLLPRTIQLCIHCRENPAGFWVSSTGGQTARRPWCLSCCDGLDPSSYAVTPFGG